MDFSEGNALMLLVNIQGRTTMAHRYWTKINPGSCLPGDDNVTETKRHLIISRRARSQYFCLLPPHLLSMDRNATHGCCATVKGKRVCAYGMIGWWRSVRWGGSSRNISTGETLIQLQPWATTTLITSLALKIWLKEEALTRKGNPKDCHLWGQAGNMKAVSKLAKRNIQGICKKWLHICLFYYIAASFFFFNPLVVCSCSCWQSQSLLLLELTVYNEPLPISWCCGVQDVVGKI